MRKKFTFSRCSTVVTALVLVVTSLSASADDRFSVTLGAHDSLVIVGPNHERQELPVPSISVPVTIGATAFQVSYGRDANNLLTAIIAPNPTQPQDLHFNVLSKSVDADKQAVVTLTFSPNSNGNARVSVDPGYVGSVQVNSRTVHRSEVASSAPVRSSAPAPAPTTIAPRSNDDMTPRGDLSPASVSYDAAPAGGSYEAPTATATTQVQKKEPIFWAEPVTPPNGTPPDVGPTQMKLVEVQGNVTVRTPGGETRDGSEGMVIPSGSTVSTPAGSSVAVFMGGVNSARLLPDTEAQVTQHVNGATRNTMIDLHQGTVFSRVGHRPGETQDYEVRTPEGVAAARGTEFADHRGHGHHYVFVAKNEVDEVVNGQVIRRLTGIGGDVDKGAMPPADDVDKVFQEIMEALQPFNSKLHGVIDRINDGTATAADRTFYNNLKNTFFEEFGPIFPYDPNHPNDYLLPITSDTGMGGSVHGGIVDPFDYENPNPLDLLPGFRRSVDQDLVPFGTNPLTPF